MIYNDSRDFVAGEWRRGLYGSGGKTEDPEASNVHTIPR